MTLKVLILQGIRISRQLIQDNYQGMMAEELAKQPDAAFVALIGACLDGLALLQTSTEGEFLLGYLISNEEEVDVSEDLLSVPCKELRSLDKFRQALDSNSLSSVAEGADVDFQLFLTFNY